MKLTKGIHFHKSILRTDRRQTFPGADFSSYYSPVNSKQPRHWESHTSDVIYQGQLRKEPKDRYVYDERQPRIHCRNVTCHFCCSTYACWRAKPLYQWWLISLAQETVVLGMYHLEWRGLFNLLWWSSHTSFWCQALARFTYMGKNRRRSLLD